MELERIGFQDNPERITQEKYDCIWVLLEDRKTPSPLKSAALQCLDWKLQGQISRFLKEGGAEHTTFIPTMRKVSTPYLAIETSGKADMEGFLKNCEGLQLKQVLCFVESRDQISDVEKFFKKASREGFPQVVFLGSDVK